MRTIKIETDNGEYSMELRNKEKDLWGIFSEGQRLRKLKINCANIFEYEPQPSNRSNEWIKEFSFTYEEAKKRLQELE